MKEAISKIGTTALIVIAVLFGVKLLNDWRKSSGKDPLITL